MSLRSPNRTVARLRQFARYWRPVALSMIVILSGLLVYVLIFEDFSEVFPGNREDPASALSDAAEAELSSTESVISVAGRQTQSSEPADRDALPDRDPVSDVVIVATPATTDSEDDALAGAEQETRASSDQGENEPEKPELSIAGAVLDDRGSLLPGVTVQAHPAGAPGQSRSPAASSGTALRQVTDQLGSFVFEPLHDGEYQLSVDDTEAFHGTVVRVRAGVANAELRVQRIREVRVYGQIVDEMGVALENVRVRDLGGKPAPLSDAEGSYEIIVAPVRAGQAPVLEFQLPGYRSQRRPVEAIVGSDADAVRLDVEMEPTGEQVEVLGHVSGPSGEPVSDVEVWLSSADPRNYLSTVSNEGGEYRFEGVEMGQAYRLGVEPGVKYRKYISEAFAVGPGNTAHDVRLETAGHGSLSGRLIDPEGRGLGHFTVWLRSQDSAGQAPIPVSSDSNGNFEVDQVPIGTLRLESTSQPRLQAGGIELQPGQARYLEVPLDWGERWLFGKVVDGNGEPLAGAQVTLQWSGQHNEITSSSHRRAATDLAGFFTFSNLGAPDYSVTVQAPGFETLRRNYAPGDTDLEIALQSTAMAGGGR
ncbi:MAG: carboxypeptidase-like regulatory domain-containing protein [Wenzhouxiangellaceae bacterium]|nr:carboxypeptidase-like regulatory domain-containing protein [Wenzhouxiangellaceae bacterium]